jgi:hypothetical protein
MLTNAAGRLLDKKLYVEVAVESDAPVIGAEHRQDGLWHFEAVLSEGENRITACSETEKTEIAVHYLPRADKKYALSVDDNIWWLAELTRCPRNSLFDHPYLAVYKRAHELYGAKVRLNLFYQVEGKAVEKYGAFDLSQMTDRYKAEFEANSDWLHLAFHSLQESPGHPYKTASAEQVLADWRKVKQEILRFAGEKSLEMATTIHFGSCTEEGISALRADGIKMLMGFMSLDRQGVPSVSYNLSVERVLQTQRYGFWKDKRSGMTYGKIDVVMNSHSPENIVRILDREKEQHPLRGFCEIMIHEQYFYEDYFNYEPDYEQRILAGCRWCHEHGYEGAFAQDVL